MGDRTERSRRYYLKNKERIKSKTHAYYEANKEKCKTNSKKFYEANKPRMLVLVADWQAKNHDKVIAAKKKWRDGNPEKQREATRLWAKQHPVECLARAHRHRALKVNARGTCTGEQAAGRVALYGGLCAYCGIRPYEHLDHVIALSKGGTNWPANIRPACRWCNTSKGNKPLAVWRAIQKNIAIYPEMTP